MGMDVWVNVFPMPFLCANYGPWRKMSRAWPPMSAITTSSGSTCPSHQESALGAAEARQERVILEVVRKAIVAGQFYFICCGTHLQIFSVSTVLAEKTSDVDQSWRASAQLSGRRLLPHWTGRGQLIKGVMFGELIVSLFVTLRVCVGGSVNVEVVKKGIIAGRYSIICRTHLQMFSVSTVLGEKASDVGAVLRSISQASWPSPTTTLDRKRTTKRRRHVWWVEGFALCLRSVHGWLGMDVWVNVFPMPFLCVDSGPCRKMSSAWKMSSACPR